MEDLMLKIKDYEFLKKEFDKKDIISLEELLSSYEDKLLDIARLEEELQHLKQNVEDNYRQIKMEEQI